MRTRNFYFFLPNTIPKNSWIKVTHLPSLFLVEIAKSGSSFSHATGKPVHSKLITYSLTILLMWNLHMEVDSSSMKCQIFS